MLLAGMDRINVVRGEFVLTGEPVGAMSDGSTRMATAAAVGAAKPSLRRRRIERFRHPRVREDGRSPGSAQKFLSTHAAVYNTFNVQRHPISAQTHRALRGVAMTTWRTAVAAA